MRGGAAETPERQFSCLRYESVAQAHALWRPAVLDRRPHATNPPSNAIEAAPRIIVLAVARTTMRLVQSAVLVM